MNRHRILVAGATALLASSIGCSDALSAHADVAAKAESHELSVDRLGNLLGESPAPVRKDVARSIADIWVNYNLLAHAGALGDSLGSDMKLVDEAMTPLIQRQRIEKLYAEVSKAWKNKPVDSTGLEARYNQGEFLSARHILIPITAGSTPEQAQSLVKEAETIRREVTSANFATYATKYSKDPGSAPNGGMLGVFPKGVMVPEFERALLAIKPGEISPLVRTQYGIHIIRRSLFAEVKPQVAKTAGERAIAVAESTYLAKLEGDAKIDIKSNGVLTVKAVALDVEGHLNDNAVIASMQGEDFTAAMLAKLMRTIPQKAQLLAQIQQAPDTLVQAQFLKPVLRTELLMREANARKIELDTAQLGQVRRTFFQLLHGAWNGLQIGPTMLTDSTKASTADKEKIAVDRVEKFFDKLIKQEAQFVEVPPPLEMALRTRFKYSVSTAGIDRAVEKAHKVRAAIDSAKTKNAPASAVPVPGGPAAASPAPAAPSKKP